MPSAIRVPTPIDLTDQRVQVGDTLEFVEKINTTQETFENLAGELGNFAEDLGTVASETEAAAEAAATAQEEAETLAQSAADDAVATNADRSAVATDRQAAETARADAIAARDLAQQYKDDAASSEQATAADAIATNADRAVVAADRVAAQNARDQAEQFAALAVSGVVYLGVWDPVDGDPPVPAVEGEAVDGFYRLATAGTVHGQNVVGGDELMYDVANATWFRIGRDRDSYSKEESDTILNNRFGTDDNQAPTIDDLISEYGLGETDGILHTFNGAEDWAKPAGWRGFVYAPAESAGGPAVDEYFFYEVIASRNAAGGYQAIAIGTNNGAFYFGGTHDQLEAPTWTQIATKNADGSITATDFILSSDRRLKTGLTRIETPVEKIDQLNGYIGTFLSKPDSKRAFLIAQEVQEVLPEAVSTGSDGYFGVSYDSLIPLLVEAIKEMSSRLRSLEGN